MPHLLDLAWDSKEVPPNKVAVSTCSGKLRCIEFGHVEASPLESIFSVVTTVVSIVSTIFYVQFGESMAVAPAVGAQ